MNIFQSLFGTAPNTNPTQNNQPPQNNQPAQNNPTQNANPGDPLPGTNANNKTAPNGVVPANANVDPNVNHADPVSPLKPFEDIWQTVVQDPKDPNAPQLPQKLDPQKVLEAARKVDFTRVITPQMMEGIAKGGADAVKALPEILQAVTQLAYAQNALATNHVVENALAKQAEKFQADLPAQIRKLTAGENLAENPLLTDPAIQPLVGALTEQLTRKYPNATSADISKQVSAYFDAVGKQFTPKPPEPKAKAGETDWSKFLESPF